MGHITLTRCNRNRFRGYREIARSENTVIALQATESTMSLGIRESDDGGTYIYHLNIPFDQLDELIERMQGMKRRIQESRSLLV